MSVPSEPYTSVYTNEQDAQKEQASTFFVAGFEQSDSRRAGHVDDARRKRLCTVLTGVLGGLCIAILLALVLGLTVAAEEYSSMHAEVTVFQCPSGFDNTTDGQLVFFAVGDWGRGGNASQQLVADMMAQVASCMSPAFIISTGDNFYEHGLEAAEDPNFTASFTDVYSTPSLKGLPWYSVLGNHDYGDTLTEDDVANCTFSASNSLQGAFATLQECEPGCCYSPLWQVSELNAAGLDERWHLSSSPVVRSFEEQGLDLFFIDTNPYISRYMDMPWANNTGGLLSQNPLEHHQQLDKLLRASTAKLKVVVGHHPIVSYGSHCTNATTAVDCTDLSNWLQPLLEQHGVLAYVSGHEHDLQYIRSAADQVSYIVSGAGSDIRAGEFGTSDAFDGVRYLEDANGFVAFQLVGGDLIAHYYTANSSKPTQSYPLEEPVL